jgi:hypothetical protein
VYQVPVMAALRAAFSSQLYVVRLFAHFWETWSALREASGADDYGRSVSRLSAAMTEYVFLHREVTEHSGDELLLRANAETTRATQKSLAGHTRRYVREVAESPLDDATRLGLILAIAVAGGPEMRREILRETLLCGSGGGGGGFGEHGKGDWGALLCRLRVEADVRLGVGTWSAAVTAALATELDETARRSIFANLRYMLDADVSHPPRYCFDPLLYTLKT